MRRLLILAILGLAGVLGTTGKASAFWPYGGPYYTSAAFPLANPPGYYTNLYYYGWMYPWYAGYNYSHGHYNGWWQNGGHASYGICGSNPASCPIPGYVGGPQYSGPPFAPNCASNSSHAGGPNGMWLQGGAGAGTGVPTTGTTPASTPGCASCGTVSINLPTDAKLAFNGTPAAGTGSVRTFQTPPLTPGQDYSYTLSAEVVVDGKLQLVSEKVIVRAGEETKVTLAAK